MWSRICYGLRRFETHFLNAPITADCFGCQLGFLLLSSCFVKLVNSNRVNCVKHWVLCKLFDPQTTAMSSCGNFAIVGDAHGNVDMFNIQSGIHRGSLGEPKGLFDTPLIRHIAQEETALQWLACWIERSGLENWPSHCAVFLTKTLYSSPRAQLYKSRFKKIRQMNRFTADKCHQSVMRHPLDR